MSIALQVKTTASEEIQEWWKYEQNIECGITEWKWKTDEINLPVCSQPSMIVEFVAFGLLKYPFITWGPRTQSSPVLSGPRRAPDDTSTIWNTKKKMDIRKEHYFGIGILLLHGPIRAPDDTSTIWNTKKKWILQKNIVIYV